jgi:hypothetical protein
MVEKNSLKPIKLLWYNEQLPGICTPTSPTGERTIE